MNKISIVICTYNRSLILQEAIISILEHCKSFNDYEILVVDNNSKDDTERIVSELRKKYFNINYVLEKNQGLSAARNRGIREVKNDLLLFLDDDVLIESDIVRETLSFFENNKNLVCGGGKIETFWEREKPEWFNDGFFSIIGETKYGNSVRELTGNEYPYGGNMFFKKSLLKEIGYFNEDLGLKGDEIKMGEEVEFFSRIKAKGYKIYYNPKITIKHRVHFNKVDKHYIVNRWREEGKATGIILSQPGGKKIAIEKFKRFLILYIRDYPKFFIAKIFYKKNEFFWKAKIIRSKEILKYL